MPRKKPTDAAPDSGERVLILRTCSADMSSSYGFVWPASGPVECPDWNPRPFCGSGLHGFLWGEGDHELANWNEDAKWLVVSVLKSEIVDLDRKVKFPRGEVVCCGTRLEATTYLIEHGGRGYSVIGATATAGDRGTATAGDAGTATAGDRGTATAGDEGTATAGDEGTATAGDAGTATAGDEGTVILRRWNGKRYKCCIGHIGEDGLLPNVPYRLDGEGRFVAVQALQEA